MWGTLFTVLEEKLTKTNSLSPGEQHENLIDFVDEMDRVTRKRKALKKFPSLKDRKHGGYHFLR